MVPDIQASVSANGILREGEGGGRQGGEEDGGGRTMTGGGAQEDRGEEHGGGGGGRKGGAKRNPMRSAVLILHLKWHSGACTAASKRLPQPSFEESCI